MRRIRTVAALALALAVASGLAACRSEEQHRSLSLSKGTYDGKPDTPPDAKVTAALRDRLKTQSY
jgi:hypothetical protein